MQIGLYFGSFNPVHIGHLIIASYVANHAPLQKVWLVVSPQNPLKPSKTLLNEYDRLHLAKLAVEDDPQLQVTDIEFHLPRPSYTIDTLIFLQERYPQHEFSIIMGSDSYQNLDQWKNPEILLRDYNFYIYLRPGFAVQSDRSNIHVLQAPLLEISATTIRQLVKAGKSVRYLVPEKVRSEIEYNQYFR